MMSADRDLIAFVLRHGEVAARTLSECGERLDSHELRAAGGELAWLVKVNRPDWSHDVHTDDCLSDWAEKWRDGMTASTVVENHRLHMRVVHRIESALRGVR